MWTCRNQRLESHAEVCGLGMARQRPLDVGLLQDGTAQQPWEMLIDGRMGVVVPRFTGPTLFSGLRTILLDLYVR